MLYLCPCLYLLAFKAHIGATGEDPMKFQNSNSTTNVSPINYKYCIFVGNQANECAYAINVSKTAQAQ